MKSQSFFFVKLFSNSKGMMFLNSGEKGENDSFRYILTIAIVISAYAVLGYIPLYIALSSKGGDISQFSNSSDMVSVLGSNLFLTLILIPFIIVLLALFFCAKYIHNRPVLSLFTIRKSFDWKRFFFSFIVWGGIMAVFLFASIVVGFPIELNFNPSTFFMLLLISVFILPIQTTCEEVLFRGYLFQGLGAIFKRGWVSVVLTGVLFGLMHGSNPEVDKLGMILMVFYIMNGIFLGLIALMDDGLELTMGYHAVNNIFAALIITNNWQAFHTDALLIDNSPPAFGIESILTLFIVQPLLLLVFAKKYKWSNWKERIFNSTK